MVATTKRRSRPSKSVIPEETEEISLVPQEEPKAPEPLAKHVLPTLRPNSMTEKGFMPRGTVVRVPCDIYPGLEGFAVRFNVSIAYRIFRDDYEGPGETAVEKGCRKMAAMVDGFEGWNFIDPLTEEVIPEPNHEDWESWRCINWTYGALTELFDWIMGVGYTKALNIATGNS